MCNKDILFCIFYYLGFIALGGAFLAGIIVTIDWIKIKNKKEEKES